MFITQMALPRRTFLRGLGATLALPLLDAMIPALSAAGPTGGAACRLGFVYVPNGVNPYKWTPTGEGTSFTLSPTLAPLEPFRNRLVAVSGLASMPGEAQGDGAGDHARASGSFLSGVHPKRTQGADFRSGKTMDQFAADVIGKDSQFPSLELTTEGAGLAGICDGAYTCTYQNTLCWRNSTTPLPMQNDPRVVFERLFGSAGTPEEQRKLLRAQGSILDSITQEALRLQSRLGVGDRSRMDQYLEGIRELERRIQKTEQRASLEFSAAAIPVEIPDVVDDHIKLMFDLQVMAFQADLTRVSTFLIAKENSQRTYPQIGVPDAHHGLSHHGENPVFLEKLAKIDNHHVDLFAYYLKKLADTPDGDGSLLDHSLTLYGSGISNGNNHSHRNLPLALVGGAAGRITGGRHVVCEPDTPLTNLQLTLLSKVGVDLEHFGDSTGVVSAL